MRLTSKHTFVLLPAIAAVSAHRSSAPAPQPASDKPLRSKLAIEYSYAPCNEPPGSCTRISIIGSDASSFNQSNTAAVSLANNAIGSPQTAAMTGTGR
jgi:hypothetical protein